MVVSSTARSREDDLTGEPIKVICITGAHRSGSTLLAQILGQIEGFWSMGEVRALWTRGLVNEQRMCLCGESPRQCSFWSKVLMDAFGDDFDPTEAMRLHDSVDRKAVAVRHFLPMQPRHFQESVGAYGRMVTRLFQAVRDMSGADVLVDASKQAAHASPLALQPGIELHIVHLVRDPRAVAFSWKRAKLEQRPPHRSALNWNYHQVSTMLLARKAQSYTRVRYEDLITQPRAAIERILESTRMPVKGLDFIHDGSVDLTPSHLLGGNPLRSTLGNVPLRLDDEWERAMPSRERLFVNLMTWPVAAWLR